MFLNLVWHDRNMMSELGLRYFAFTTLSLTVIIRIYEFTAIPKSITVVPNIMVIKIWFYNKKKHMYLAAV